MLNKEITALICHGKANSSSREGKKKGGRGGKMGGKGGIFATQTKQGKSVLNFKISF